MTDKIDTLGDALPGEMSRVRDVVLPKYLANPAGRFAAHLIRNSLDRAQRALAEGDVAAMARCHEDLKSFSL